MILVCNVSSSSLQLCSSPRLSQLSDYYPNKEASLCSLQLQSDQRCMPCEDPLVSHMTHQQKVYHRPVVSTDNPTRFQIHRRDLCYAEAHQGWLECRSSTISCSRTEGIFTLTESFYTAIIPKGDIIVSTISSIDTTRVDNYTYHEVFCGRERLSIALVLLDGFLVWEIFINVVRMRL